MRLLTYQTADGPAAAIQVDETLVPADAVDAPASTVRGLLEALDGEGLRELAARAETAEERVPLAEATLCAPIPDANRIICLGLNYRDHAEETGQERLRTPNQRRALAAGNDRQADLRTSRPRRVALAHDHPVARRHNRDRHARRRGR